MYYPPPKEQEVVLKDVSPFSPLIIKANYNKFDWNTIKKFCEDVTLNSDATGDTNWGAGSYSDISNVKDNDVPHLNPLFAEFYGWLNPIAVHIITNEYGYDKNMGYVIYNSWINLHVPGGHTNVHSHGACVLSVATYLYMPEDGGYIEFKDPLEYHKTFFPTPIEAEIVNWKTVPTKTGDVVLFPGWLRHRTQQNKSKERRWVLTTNYICTNIPNQENNNPFQNGLVK